MSKRVQKNAKCAFLCKIVESITAMSKTRASFLIRNVEDLALSSFLCHNICQLEDNCTFGSHSLANFNVDIFIELIVTLRCYLFLLLLLKWITCLNNYLSSLVVRSKDFQNLGFILKLLNLNYLSFSLICHKH